MDYRITQIEMVKDSPLLYVEVEFLEAGEVVHRNDFLMQIASSRRVYNGPPLAEGERPNPANYATLQPDIAGEITDNIENYMTRFEAKAPEQRKADSRSRRIERDTVDRLGFLARSEVRALIGKSRSRAR